MTEIDRPEPRPLFLVPDRRLEVFFHTSNLDKYLQARLVFDRFGLVLRHFKRHTEPYSEDYSGTKQHLLEQALKEIQQSLGHSSSLFFVEDTSLRIDALSEAGDFPGLSVKEWFAGTSFQALDGELKAHGNDRSATVSSDIGLHLPGLSRPVYFHGSVPGTIAKTPPAFVGSEQFPWLTASTFNGWFIPGGAQRRLGEMTLEESWRFDFRIKALVSLINRLEEYAAALNLSPPAYARRPYENESNQLDLFPIRGSVLVVVGPTCAGKTTFAEVAAAKYGLRTIEASSVLRSFRSLYEPSEIEHLEPFSFARKVLSDKGPDIVARQILSLYLRDKHESFVITGFRTIEEVEVIRQALSNVRVVLIDASPRTRYQRYINRGREGAQGSFSEFQAIDGNQRIFGLLRVAEDFADIKIENEGTMREYERQIDVVVTGEGVTLQKGVTIVPPTRTDSERSQLYRSLVVLGEAARPLNCNEIDELTTTRGHKVRFNNANKVLKRVPELAQRLEHPGTKVRYAITNAGRAYVRLTNNRAAPAQEL